MITLANHVLPSKSNNTIQTTYINKKVEEKSYQETFPMSGESLILTLLRDNGRAGF